MRTLATLILFVTGWLAAVPASAQQVSVWLTTDDQHSKLEAQPAVAFAPASPADNPVVVDEARTYQTIEGFGASFTDSSAYLLNQVASPAARAEAMNAPLHARGRRHRPQLHPQPDGRVGSGAHPLLLRRPAGGPDRSRARALLHRARRGRTSSRSCSKRGELNPQHEDHGDAMEPARLDEVVGRDDRRDAAAVAVRRRSPITS